ncbi:hypothetical protein X735_15375 [Mesorhizobium sp. L2C085B000]|nr:hypothetical protein X735_15375 [Mesorhizobium sp. L2C085B000]
MDDLGGLLTLALNMMMLPRAVALPMLLGDLAMSIHKEDYRTNRADYLLDV